MVETSVRIIGNLDADLVQVSRLCHFLLAQLVDDICEGGRDVRAQHQLPRACGFARTAHVIECLERVDQSQIGCGKLFTFRMDPRSAAVALQTELRSFVTLEAQWACLVLLPKKKKKSENNQIH